MRPLVIVALVTPYSRDGGIDLGAVRAHVEELVEAGVDGLFVCGTTGEGPLLDDDEVALMTRTVVATCGGRAAVTAHIGRPGTAATIRVLGLALEAGANAVAAVTPYYYELDDARLEAHYAELIAASDGSPLFAYAIPRRAGNDLDPALVARLADRGLAGVKDSTRLPARHAEYLRIAGAHPHRFEVYMGTDSLALEALERGSTGIVSAVANARPDLFLALRAAFDEGRNEEALALQHAINAVRDALRAGAPLEGLKTAVAGRLASRGVVYPTVLRPPLGTSVR
jgi:4-hydroxy-tetrahydrodipicolinate synthase/2-dehydro-3-deoxy-phosphogluconate/2-dehydro-3-deoxy-6-phosphogalactonate aldolase